jgi:hypothetical protein
MRIGSGSDRPERGTLVDDQMLARMVCKRGCTDVRSRRLFFTQHARHTFDFLLINLVH